MPHLICAHVMCASLFIKVFFLVSFVQNKKRIRLGLFLYYISYSYIIFNLFLYYISYSYIIFNLFLYYIWLILILYLTYSYIIFLILILYLTYSYIIFDLFLYYIWLILILYLTYSYIIFDLFLCFIRNFVLFRRCIIFLVSVFHFSFYFCLKITSSLSGLCTDSSHWWSHSHCIIHVLKELTCNSDLR